VSWLARDLDALEPSALSARLLVLATHRVDAGARLQAWLEAGDLGLRRAAALLARHTGAPAALRSLARCMDDPDPRLRWTAIESGLIRGQHGAWARIVELALAEPPACDEATRRRALGWIGALGDRDAHARLLADLVREP